MDFRKYAATIARHLLIAATQDLALEEVEITTPMGVMVAQKLSIDQVIWAVITRAGNSLLVDDILPKSPRVFIDIKRDEETAKANFHKISPAKNMGDRRVIVLDPMLATGGSAIKAIEVLRREGAGDISFACVIAAPEGILALRQAYHDVRIFTCAVDDYLNERFYIKPGVGDWGDRYCGTD